jgi:carbonic anhydrase
MKTLQVSLAILIAVLFTASKIQAQKHADNTKSLTGRQEISHPLIQSPDDALEELKKGNQRFLENKLVNTNYREQIQQNKSDQHPHSLVLSCLDSRIPPEIIFDQGIGNIFVARVAGNIEDANIIGSMEFATKVKGTRLIVVMGHNKCGAVKGAIDHADLGSLTQLVSQIAPAITGDTSDMDGMLTESAKKNVELTIQDILKGSPVINDLVKEGKVKIAGAFYDITTGKVIFI